MQLETAQKTLSVTKTNRANQFKYAQRAKSQFYFQEFYKMKFYKTFFRNLNTNPKPLSDIDAE